MNKKYGFAVLAACAILASLFVFIYDSSQTNSGVKNLPSSGPNVTINSSTKTEGRHFFVGINESVNIRTNP